MTIDNDNSKFIFETKYLKYFKPFFFKPVKLSFRVYIFLITLPHNYFLHPVLDVGILIEIVLFLHH